jgi:predicted GNAT family acetyltransferase
VQFTVHRSPTEFWAKTRAALEAQEAENNVLIGITDALIRLPDRYPEWHLYSVSEGDRAQAAALQTPPHKMNVFGAHPAAIPVLAAGIHGEQYSLSGVNGKAETVNPFAEVWNRLTGTVTQVERHMRLFELRTVIPPHGVTGIFEKAALEWRNTLIDWADTFEQEALGSTSHRAEAEMLIDRHLTAGSLYVWLVEGNPVSMAARGRQTAHGAVVNLVYTPPDRRGHGYASGLVAALSQHILNEGKAFTALFTDLANPISNSIYQKIGYRSVADFDDLAFQPPA